MPEAYNPFVKYLIVSDIHGSEMGGIRLKEALAREKPDCLILLGDLLHGAYDSDPFFIIGILKTLSIGILAVCGNCDDPYGDAEALGIELPDSRELSFQGHCVHLQHRPFVASFEEGSILLNGHTHRKTLYEENGVIHCNPGSLALPRDDSPSYATMDEDSLVLVNAMNGLAIEKLSINPRKTNLKISYN